jgi:hypothetical protein
MYELTINISMHFYHFSRQNNSEPDNNEHSRKINENYQQQITEARGGAEARARARAELECRRFNTR